MKNISQWQHYKKNYLMPTVVLTGFGILSLIFGLLNNEKLWYLSFTFLILAWIIIPIGNYFSWKSKF